MNPELTNATSADPHYGGYLPAVGWATNCRVSANHSPVPLRFVWHHILPQVCGGQSVPENLANLCDNCFPYETPVDYLGLQRVSRRWFDGELVELTLGGGRKLAGTPNHPVLTPGGWTPLGMLQKGDDLVADNLQMEPLREGHVHRMPAKIGEVFDALAVAGVVRLSAARVDFHGERPNGDVDVVSTDRQLRLDRQAAASQFGGDSLLPTADAESDPLARLGSADQFGLGPAAAEHALVGVGSKGSALSGAERTHSELVGLRAAAPHHPASTQEPFERPLSNSGLTREPEGRFARTVALEPVRGVRRFPFSGHVYNLQTASGEYCANGITVHNCHYATHALLHDLKVHGGKFTIAAKLRNHRRAALAQQGYKAAVAAGTVDLIPNEGASE